MQKDTVSTAKPILERFSLKNKVALVTGAAQGIGRAYCHALGEAGASVALVDINADKLKLVHEELKNKGIDSIIIIADITKKAETHRMVQEIINKWKKLDIAVNNAGTCGWFNAETMEESEWDRIMNLNLKGVFLCCQAEVEEMMKHGYGKIINMASMSGSIVNRPQNQCHYNTSKAAVIQLTKSLAAEWVTKGVRVNCISPTYIETDLLKQNEDAQKFIPLWIENTPMKKLGDVTDLQGAVVFLASEASDLITGHDLVVDAGYTIW